MSTRTDSGKPDPIIESRDQLIAAFAAGEKPPEHWRIGTEHEKFGFRHSDLKTPPYEPADGQPGCIRDLLLGLETFGATPILDHGNTIGLKQGDASVELLLHRWCARDRKRYFSKFLRCVVIMCLLC